MPHENSDDETSRKSVSNIYNAWNEMDWAWLRTFTKHQHEAEKRKRTKEALNLNVQAAKFRAKQHPKWRSIIRLIRENPVIAALALVFFPVTISVLLYLYLRRTSA